MNSSSSEPIGSMPLMRRQRSPWLAALLSFCFPGAGQLYNGSWRGAILAFLLPFLLLLAYALLLLPWLPSSNWAGWMVLAAPLLGQVVVAGHAWAVAERNRDQPRHLLAALAMAAVLIGLTASGGIAPALQHWPGVRSYTIPSPAMAPTLRTHDYILSYPRSSYGRGDIVVFTPPAAYLAMGHDHADLVKRIIAVGGDTVEIKDGKLLLNHQAQDEPYIYGAMTTGDFPKVKIGPGEFFMMGDNRNDSFDSRYWGTVPENNVKSRVERIFLADHLDRIGIKL